MTALRAVDQLGMDEHVIPDKEVEAALEARQRAKEALAAPQAAYTEAHEVAKGLIGRLELPEGATARVGRFRVTARHIPARVTSFDTKARTQLSIAIAED